jgi:hypothetical protein
MATKLRAHRDTYNIPATIVTANLPKDTIVSITADKTVDRAGANALFVGRVLKPARAANGSGTIETRFNALVEVKASGAVAAGAEVKLAAVDPVTGENRVSTWVDGVDSPSRKYGVCWKGGADAATLEVLEY